MKMGIMLTEYSELKMIMDVLDIVPNKSVNRSLSFPCPMDVCYITEHELSKATTELIELWTRFLPSCLGHN